MEHAPQTENRESIGQLKHIADYVRQIKWFLAALPALLVFLLIKLLLLDIITVNGKDMRLTYEYGDVLLIKKSFNSYRTNDVVYVQYPVKDSATAPDLFFIQRLIGLPGDSISLRAKAVYINNIRIEDPAGLKNNYFIGTGEHKLDSNFLQAYHLAEGGQVSNKFDYSFSLTKAECAALKSDSAIKKVELKSEKPNSFDETCFPYSSYYPWNMDHYGPIYIPRKNDTIALDSLNLPLYASLIQNYEHYPIEAKHDSIFINGQFTRFYVFEKNYFFVLGDNRDNANDSRVWGFLPEDGLKGKVIARLKKGKQ